MSTVHRVELDSTLRCPDAVEFEKRMKEHVVGQDEAIDKATLLVQTFMAGFNPPGRPAGVLLFLGPTWDSALRTPVQPGPRLPSAPRPLSSLLPREVRKKGIRGGKANSGGGLTRPQSQGFNFFSPLV
jgi:hypothetical protein